MRFSVKSGMVPVFRLAHTNAVLTHINSHYAGGKSAHPACGF
jgi:hypothetical protein